jgi:hypothetical protein
MLSYKRLGYNLQHYTEVDITDVAMVMSHGTTEVKKCSTLCRLKMFVDGLLFYAMVKPTKN